MVIVSLGIISKHINNYQASRTTDRAGLVSSMFSIVRNFVMCGVHRGYYFLLVCLTNLRRLSFFYWKDHCGKRKIRWISQ